MDITQTIVAQFKKPSGWLGKLAGHVMANRRSNIERNRWVVDLLKLKDTDRVLELGYGPGIAIDYAAQQLRHGEVIGIDHSGVMFAQANRRNAAHITRGRVKLILGTVDKLGDMPEKFDCIYSSNVVQFWEHPAEVYRKLRASLKDEGIIATQLMPRTKGADVSKAEQMGENIAQWLRQSGFSDVHIEHSQFGKFAAVCVLAKNSSQ